MEPFFVEIEDEYLNLSLVRRLRVSGDLVDIEYINGDHRIVTGEKGEALANWLRSLEVTCLVS